MENPSSDNALVAPADGELEILRAIADALADASTARIDLQTSTGAASFELPPSAIDGLEQLVTYLAADKAVAMRPYGDSLTTGQAAELLGMSRQHLVNLVDSGALPISARKVGTGEGSHRRIALADVVAYNELRDVEAELASAKSEQDRAIPLNTDSKSYSTPKNPTGINLKS